MTIIVRWSVREDTTALDVLFFYPRVYQCKLYHFLSLKTLFLLIPTSTIQPHQTPLSPHLLLLTQINPIHFRTNKIMHIRPHPFLPFIIQRPISDKAQSGTVSASIVVRPECDVTLRTARNELPVSRIRRKVMPQPRTPIRRTQAYMKGSSYMDLSLIR